MQTLFRRAAATLALALVPATLFTHNVARGQETISEEDSGTQLLAPSEIINEEAWNESLRLRDDHQIDECFLYFDPPPECDHINNYCSVKCTNSSSCNTSCRTQTGGFTTCGSHGVCSAPSCSSTCKPLSSCSTRCKVGNRLSTCGAQAECDTVRTARDKDRVKEGSWVESTVSYKENSGHARMITEVTNHRSVHGFTGGAQIAFVDENQLPLYVTTIHSIGIKPCGFKCPKRRSVNWSVNVPADIRDKVRGIAVLHAHTPTFRVGFGSLKVIGVVNDILGVVLTATGAGTPAKVASKIVKLMVARLKKELGNIHEDAIEQATRQLLAQIESKAQMF